MFEYTGTVTKDQIEKLLKIPYETYQGWKVDKDKIDLADVVSARSINNEIAVRYAEMMDVHSAVKTWAEDRENRLKRVKTEAKRNIRVARCLHKGRVTELIREHKAMSSKDGAIDASLDIYILDNLTATQKVSYDISNITSAHPGEITSDTQAADIAEGYAYDQIPDYEDAMNARTLMDTIYNYINKIASRIDANFIGYGIQVKLIKGNQ